MSDVEIKLIKFRSVPTMEPNTIYLVPEFVYEECIKLINEGKINKAIERIKEYRKNVGVITNVETD